MTTYISCQNRTACCVCPPAVAVCTTCHEQAVLGCNPNRPNGPWVRCYICGSLWDNDHTPIPLPLTREYQHEVLKRHAPA